MSRIVIESGAHPEFFIEGNVQIEPSISNDGTNAIEVPAGASLRIQSWNEDPLQDTLTVSGTASHNVTVGVSTPATTNTIMGRSAEFKHNASLTITRNNIGSALILSENAIFENNGIVSMQHV